VNSTTLLALNQDGSKKWDYEIFGYGEGALGTTVDPSGTIYVATRVHTASSPSGFEVWEGTRGKSNFLKTAIALSRYGIPLGGQQEEFVGSLRFKENLRFQGSNAPAIGTDGSVYSISKTGFLFASHPDGTPAWQIDLGKISFTNETSPAIGADGTIYAGSESGSFFAVNPDGSINWKQEAPVIRGINNSPVVGPDGTVYVVGVHTLYALHDDTGELPNRWNTFRGDVTRSGRALAPLSFPFFDRGSPTQNDSFGIVVIAEPNQPAEVERSTDLTKWDFLDRRSSANGFIYYEDTGFPESNHTYYRTFSE
jgi:outer membrane protein assembly factor BamB